MPNSPRASMSRVGPSAGLAMAMPAPTAASARARMTERMREPLPEPAGRPAAGTLVEALGVEKLAVRRRRARRLVRRGAVVGIGLQAHPREVRRPVRPLKPRKSHDDLTRRK